MEKVKSSLNKSEVGKKSPGANAAEQAQNQIDGMVQALSDIMSSMNSNAATIDPYRIQTLVYESINLGSLQQLISQSEKRRNINGWESDPVTLYSNSLQVARWLYQNLQKLSSEFPFVSSYLLTQARMLVATLEKASTERNQAQAGLALGHTQNVTRELLKLLKLVKNMPKGSGSGQGGQGEDSENNNMSNNFNGKTLSESLKGISGKQLALNQTTNDLLRSMLQSRKFRQGKGTTGNVPVKGSGQSSQELANRQGMLSESLESLAESAGNEGGAATKLRKLAEEARSLEKKMRRGSITSDLTDSQNRFKSRLLETSKALEERGFGSRREGKYSDKILFDNMIHNRVKKEKWLLLLEKEKRRVKKISC